MRQIIAVLTFGVDDGVADDLIDSILCDAHVQVAEAVEHVDGERDVPTYDVQLTWGVRP